MDFKDDELKLAKNFSEFYFDLVENQLSALRLHLTESVVLDWFGQTVKGPKNVPVFLKEHASKAKHHFHNFEPCQSVGYRDSHIINKYTSTTSKLSEPNCTEINISQGHHSQEKTPPGNNIKAVDAPPSRKRERGQGDGHHICSLESPMKRTCIGDVLINSGPKSPLKIYNITSEGHVEFRRKSPKKYQKEIKWSRPCKFQAAYSEASTGFLIHRLIYQGNMRCRRNLLKEFDALSDDNK